MLKKFVSVLLLVMIFSVLMIPAASAGSTYYVFTENGKGLNYRSAPNTGNNKLGTLDYGTRLTNVTMLGNGWAKIIFPGDPEEGAVYVMSRYLVKNKPADIPPGASIVPAATSSKDSGTVEEINALLRNARQVQPYSVTVRPTRASGWVYVRWIPSKNASAMATYADGKVLTVIAELRDWYQVTDPDTGATGFVYKSYISY